MYQIINSNSGATVGLTSQILYIKRAENGCFVFCDRQEAIGVAYNSQPYNLMGHNEIDGAQTVLVTEIDSGRLMEEIQAKNAASIDYLSMMAGIDLPEEGETNGTQPEV